MNELEKEIITEEEFDLICEYIKIRNNSKVSQRELANRTGLAQSTIARLEKNLLDGIKVKNMLRNIVKIISSITRIINSSNVSCYFYKI